MVRRAHGYVRMTRYLVEWRCRLLFPDMFSLFNWAQWRGIKRGAGLRDGGGCHGGGFTARCFCPSLCSSFIIIIDIRLPEVTRLR